MLLEHSPRFGFGPVVDAPVSLVKMRVKGQCHDQTIYGQAKASMDFCQIPISYYLYYILNSGPLQVCGIITSIRYDSV